MTENQRYSTLRDYLALLRRQRLLVVAVTVAFAGAGLAFSLSQTPSYKAEASVSFRDVSEDLRLTGINVAAGQNPLTVAAIGAEDVTTLKSARQARSRLDADVSPESLQSAVTARVGIETSFTVIEATWSDPEFAAQVANAFADVTVASARRDLVAKIDAMIDEIAPQARGTLTPGEAFTNFEKTIAKQNLFQLRQVRQAVDPAEVSRRAEVPDSATSPKTTRNTILGGMIGLALGLLAAFVRDSLDRKVRTPKDAHDELGFPVLGRVGLTALGSAGLASNGRTYVAPADLEAFRILRTNMAVLNPERPPRSVLVTSGGPEEGKSTVAAALASAAAAAGQRTLLVEADLRRPVLAARMGLRQGPGLADYLLGQAGPTEVLQLLDLSLTRGNGDAGAGTAAHQTLVCITAGTVPDQPAELLASERCQSFVSKVTKAYDLVVFDSSPMLSTADPLELMPLMGSVLLCVRLSRSTVDETRAVGSAIDLLPDRPVGLVVTGIGASDYGYYGDYAYT